MMLSGSIISVGLMNIMRFHMEKKQPGSGEWEKGPGMDLFNALKKKLGESACDRRGSGIFDRKCSGNAQRKRISGNEGIAVCV